MGKDIVSEIHRLLLKNGRTISVAESCSGGLTSSLLTRLSGSSGYFILGIVTYSNQAKTRILHIPGSLIRTKGAVCREVATKMSKSIRRLGKTDFGIGITGIAGPTGGTSQKPVGTVFICVDRQKKNLCKRYRFTGSRKQIQRKAAIEALRLLKKLVN